MNKLPPCPDWAEKLAVRQDDLAPSDRVALEAHVVECSACSAARADYNMLIVRLRTLSLSTIKPLPSFSTQILFEEDTEQVQIQKRLLSSRMPLQHKQVAFSNVMDRFQSILSVLLVASILLASIALFGSLKFIRTSSAALKEAANPVESIHPSPQQYINLIAQQMTLDQKLGQMMIVQFVGPTYSPEISMMISQYHVGAVLLFTANDNIVDKAQLKGLIQQMQSNNSIPLAVAIDQEGGTVDRLKALDGPRPLAADIGATNNPNRAKAAGIQDAQDLASYGFNLNLAPVVDVSNVYNPQLYGRTYGNNAALVTKMAQAYLQGLQQSGKVMGTLKHFPGLGDVGVDPHSGVPNLYRSKNDLEAIDWAPYRALIQQGNVHAIMVTHEIVHAIDDSKPSSLAYKVVTGILRNELGFQGVIMTDSLTMEGITAYYTEAQAAAVAVEAGSDLLMGAATPADVASMIVGIKQAMASGEISQQRIDDSVRRILMLKYQMGLLPIPKS